MTHIKHRRQHSMAVVQGKSISSYSLMRELTNCKEWLDFKKGQVLSWKNNIIKFSIGRHIKNAYQYCSFMFYGTGKANSFRCFLCILYYWELSFLSTKLFWRCIIQNFYAPHFKIPVISIFPSSHSLYKNGVNWNTYILNYCCYFCCCTTEISNF